jgi:hypothetical protein
MFKSSRMLKLTIAIAALCATSIAGFTVRWTNVFAEFNPAEIRSIGSFPPAPVAIGTCDTAGPIEVEATAGTAGPTAYATLKDSFDAINAGTHQGSITIEVCGNTNEGTNPATLNSSGAGAASYTVISIRPLADGLTISGNPATGLGVIQLNGADNVTIDGDNPNSAGTNRNLTVSNTTTATVIANSAIRIATSTAVTSADNDTIKNLNLLGNVTGGNASTITSTTGSSNSSFGIYVGGNGGATATGAPTAITSVTSNTAPSGTTINNLLVDNNAVSQCARAIVFNGAAATVSTGVTISNNVIGDQGALSPATPPFTSPSTTVYTKGIWVGGTSAITVTGNTLKNILSYVGTTMTAIEIVSPVTSSTITNNTVTNLANNGTVSVAKGILVSSNTATYTIAGNSVANVQTLANTSGTDGIEVTAAATGGTIERNRIQTVFNRNNGTFGAYGLNLTSGTGIVIKNNFISDVLMDMTGGGAFSTTFGVHGIRIAGGTGHKVYNNTVNLFGSLFGTATTSILTSAFTPTATTITGMDVRNNIFSNTITGGTTSIAHVSMFLPSSATSSMNLTINNNDYFAGTTAGSTGIAHVGTTYTAIPAGPTTFTGLYTAANFNPADTSATTNFRTYTNILSGAATNDNASIVTDPLLVSNTDLHLSSGSLARNVGAVIASVTNDIDGQLRPGGNAFYDIGADEFDGVTPPANDLQATAFIDPANGGTKLAGASFTPQSSFTNNGTNTQSSVTVRYRICADAGCSSPAYEQTAVIASIASGATTTVSFPSASIATGGIYTIKAKVELGTDTVPANDEITGTVNILAPLSGTYNVGSGGDFTSLTNTGGIFDAINTAGASANVTINITSDLSGETGTVALNENAGGFGVTIKPLGAARTITGSSANSIIRLNGADSVTIDGSLTGGTATGVGGTASLRNLTVQNTNTAATAGAVIAVMQGANSANNVTIKNVIVSGQDPTQTLVGIHVGGNTVGAAPTVASNNNVVIDNCVIKRAILGIFNDGVSAAAAATGNVISHNDLTAIGVDKLRRAGIFFFSQNGIQVTENAVGGIADDESADAIGIIAGIQNVTTTATTSGGVYNAIIAKNRISGITSTSTTGFSAVGIAIAGDPAGENFIGNNMISGISAPSTSPDIVAGIFVAGVAASNTHLLYNSVSITGDRGAISSQIGSYGVAISGANPTVELKNNIFYNTQTSGGGTNAKSYAIGIGTSAFTNLASNFNDFVSSGANVGGFRTGSLDTTGTDLANLAAWQAATSTDANSLSVDPLFVNAATDLHIPGTSPVMNAGTVLGVINDDIDGQSRGAQPDIGADEVQPGTIQFSSAAYSVGEAGPMATLTVTRTGGTDGAVSADFATSNGTATGGAACGGSVDYVNTSGTINFASGDGANKTINVPICNDSTYEGNETFNTTLSNATGGATIGATSSATTTITDDESVPTVQFSSSTYSTVEAIRSLSPDGGPGATINITLSGPSQSNVTVHYATNNGTATGGAACSAGVDYISVSGTATIMSGQTSTSFFVPTCADTAVEGDETVTLLLSSPTVATLGTPSLATLTITDNDTATGPVIVSASAGTPGPTSYPTLKDAIDAVNAGTHQGSITIGIATSTVEANAPIVLNGNGAGSASYTSIVIRPTADGVSVSGATPTGRGLIELNGADNVTIDGDNSGSAGIHRDLTLQNTATNATTFTSVVRLALAATVVTSTDNDIVKNLNIIGSATGRNIVSATSTAASENTTFGIFAGPGASTVSSTTAPAAVTSVSASVGTGATAANLIVSNNNVTTAARAISINGSATTVFPSLQITNNQIGNPTSGAADQVYSIGLTAQGSANGIISGNTVWVEGYVGSSAATQGINVGVNSATGTFTIDSNKIDRVQNNNGQTWSAYGINLGGGNNHIVQNNFVSDVINSQSAGTGGFGTTFGAYGIRVASGTGHKIYHNTVHLYGAMPGTTSTNLTASYLMTATSQTGVDVRNNIFSNQISGGNPTGTRNVAVFLPSGATSTMNLTINNNGYFSGTDALDRLAQVGATFGTGEYLTANFDPTATAPAANFRAYTSTLSAAGTNDNASFATSALPPFISDLDLHITSGVHTRLESGGAAVGVNLDIDADTRNASTPDIGADEFVGQPPFANDVAAVTLVTPANGAVIPVGQSFSPQATFSNNGTATQSSMTVRYRIVDSTMTEVYNQTVVIPSLAPLQTFTATFPSTSLPSGGSFTIIAKAELAGDQDTSNDSISGTVAGVPPVSGAINVGTGQTYTSLTNPGGIFQALNTAGISGNVTINITSDLTAETGAVALNQLAESGAGGYTVTIKPSGAVRVISGTSAATSGLIILNGADRIVIDGSTSGGTDRSLTITNNQLTTGVVIWIRSANASNGATNNTVKNCVINGAPGPNGPTVAGILTGSGVTLGNDAEAPNSNNTIQNNWIYRVQNSLYLRGGTSAPMFDQNWIVTGNELGSSVVNDKNIFRGMLIGNSQNFTVTNNFVHGVQSTTTTAAAMSGIQLALLVNTGTVSGNKISDIKNVSATGTGAYGMQISSSSMASGVTIANNFISDVTTLGSATVNSNGFGMMFNGSGTGYDVNFNSINMNTNQSAAQTSAAVNVASTFATASALSFRNNIFANTQSTGARYAVYSTAASNVFTQIDYNDYFATSVGFIGGSAQTTLANWQSATGQDANSKSDDPLFVSSSDLHLQPASTMRSMALAGTGITTDIDGEMRDANPDIGADELPFLAMPGSLQFSSPTYSISEAGGMATITVSRTGGTTGAVGVSFATSNGTATGGTCGNAGVDYANTSGTLMWADGDSANKTFTIQVCNDLVPEPDETVNIALSNATGGATIGTPASSVLTIVNDDVPGTLSVSDVRVWEGNSGTVNASFSVTYVGQAIPVSVHYATANGTAIAGSDYVATSGTLTFNAPPPVTELGGVPTQTQNVTVQVIGDNNKEENETFFLNLTNPVNAVIGDGQGVGIINDEDRAFVSDFDHDQASDLSVYRPSEGKWYVLQTTNATPKVVPFGNSDDRPVPGDYDGDGYVDYAVYRSTTGTWFIQSSIDNSVRTVNWGLAGDKPVQGDYDGDGKTDIAVYRPSTGTWWFILSSNGSQPAVQFGLSSDLPVQADYDGDNKTDIAVYRNGVWYIARSSDNQIQVANFGISTDKPVVGDFDGDGSYDLAIYRDGDWWIVNSLTGTVRSLHWGLASDIPVPADYDRDGITDIAVFRPSNGDWYILKSTTNSLIEVHWGASGDIPTPAGYLPQ